MQSVETGVSMFVHYKRGVHRNLIGQYPAHIKHLRKRQKQCWRQHETLNIMTYKAAYSKSRKAIEYFHIKRESKLLKNNYKFFFQTLKSKLEYLFSYT